MFDANFFSHFGHFQIPLDNLFTPSLLQKGQSCFFLCFSSTLTNPALTVPPYLAPNLPADFDFFSFDGILFLISDAVYVDWTAQFPTQI